MPPPGIPTGGQTPAPTPAPAPVPTPDAKPPAPVFAGTVQVKIYSDLISTGSENGQINGVDPAKMGRIQEAVKGVDGVSSVSVSSTTGILEAAYSGPYNNVEDIEKAPVGDARYQRFDQRRDVGWANDRGGALDLRYPGMHIETSGNGFG